MPDQQYAFDGTQWVDRWNNLTDDVEPAWDLSDGDSIAWWAAVLPVCICAAMESIGAAMHAYLTSADSGSMILAWSDTLECELLALLADSAGLAEHGGTVRAAWATAAGRRWVELYERAHPCHTASQHDEQG